PDFSGTADTFFSTRNPIDPLLSQPLGTNGRFCETCHVLTHGWTVSPLEPGSLGDRFTETGPPGAIGGVANASATSSNQLDPIFRPVDGSNSPTADLSTPDARPAAYS